MLCAADHPPARFALMPVPSSCSPPGLRSLRNVLVSPNLQLSMWRSEKQLDEQVQTEQAFYCGTGKSVVAWVLYNMGKALADTLRTACPAGGEPGEVSLKLSAASGLLYGLFRWSNQWFICWITFIWKASGLKFQWKLLLSIYNNATLSFV